MAQNSMGVAFLASEFGKAKKVKPETAAEREARIALYAARVAAGCDIWTGMPRKDFVTEAIEKGDA